MNNIKLQAAWIPLITWYAHYGIMKIRAHVLVRGRVQGVFFRLETKVRAEKHDVKGWIRNLPDGRVEAIFEGEDTNVRALIDFCSRGSFGAKVMGMDVSWEKYSGKSKSFNIK